MTSYETGYEDERFQHPVGQSFHCDICYNVIKHTVMCRHNEHLFCKGCITRHLMNSQTCPTCMEPLTVDTLTQASPAVINLLLELKIRCEFLNRGCERFVQLGDLERHVADCGFAPAICSNEGCCQEVNKRDLLHHETAVCELRRLKCHSCKKIWQEMDIVKLNLAAMNARLNDIDEALKRNDSHEKNVVANVEMVVWKQEESNRRFEADSLEMQKGLKEVAEQLKRLTQQREDMKKSTAEADEPDREARVVAGGWNGECLDSVETYSLSDAKWALLQPIKQPRNFASAVVYRNQIIVNGSSSNGCAVNSIEILPMKAVHVDQSILWENHPAELPKPLYGHSSVILDGRLFVVGGHSRNVLAKITETSLVYPYTSKVFATMSEGRWSHSVVLFGTKIVILGGKQFWNCTSNLKSVLSYDIGKNECQELAPLPYPVSDMATVTWGDDNVIIFGGVDNDGKPLDKVVIYNVKTQKGHMLPNLKY